MNNMVVLSDAQIQMFLNEKKFLPRNFNPAFRERQTGNQSHNHFDCEVRGENGNVFKLIVRQNKINPLDFSVILGVIISGTVFRLRRYNGDSHEHSNKIEHNTLEGFHKHTATKRYQELGCREDFYAEKATNYSDWSSALKAMIAENNFQYLLPDGQQRLK